MNGEQDNPKSNTMDIRTKGVDTHPKVVPTDFSTIHVDKVMIGIDRVSGIITMTLLQQSLIPQIGFKHEWNLSEEHWKVVGEVKMPVSEMNSVLLYYVSELTGGGVNIFEIIRQYLNEHQQNIDSRSVSYGPSSIHFGDKVTHE